MLSQRSGSNGTNDNTKIKVELPIYDYCYGLRKKSKKYASRTCFNLNVISGVHFRTHLVF